MTRNEKQELNEMSKKVFGTKSRWKKLVDFGFREEFTRDREVMVPKANGQLMKMVYTDKKFMMRRYTVEEVRKEMQDVLDKRSVVPNLTNTVENPLWQPEKAEEFPTYGSYGPDSLKTTV